MFFSDFQPQSREHTAIEVACYFTNVVSYVADYVQRHQSLCVLSFCLNLYLDKTAVNLDPLVITLLAAKTNKKTLPIT